MTETIRAARVEDAAGIARVHVNAWRTTYKGIVPDAHLANLSYERGAVYWTRRLNELTDQMFVYVAEDEQGQIVGFVEGGPERRHDAEYPAELYAIYILKEYQGRGLGRRLTHELVKSLLEAGMNAMLVWALAENPFRRFYEALGGQYVRPEQFELGGAMLDEVAYGWPDLSALLNRSE
jgi:GNAT superfamily N-acetyltransferase